MTQTPDVPIGSAPDTSPAKPRRKRRIWLWVLLILVLLLGVGRGWLAYRAHVELERYRAAGHPTTLAEYEAKYPIPPAPARNGWGELEHTGTYFNKLSDEQMDLVGGDLPEPGEPWPRDVREAAEQYLALNAPMMQAARESLRADYFRRPLTHSDPMKALLPSLGWARRLAQLIKLEHAIHRDQWPADRQIEAFNENMRLAEAISSEPSIMGQLVCVSIQALAQAQAQSMLEAGILSDAQLRQLDQAIETMIQPSRWVRAYEGDVIWSLALIDLPTSVVQTSSGPVMVQRASRLIGTVDADRMVYLPAMRELLDILELPDPRSRFERLRSLGQRLGASGGFSKADILLGSVTSTAENAVRFETRAQCVRAAVAIERYRLKHGSLPASLDELVPEYLGKVPDDLFRPEPGQPLGYLRKGDGFRVYTVDRDGVDDGGRLDKVDGVQTADFGFSVRMTSSETSPAAVPTTQAQDGP